MRFIKDRYVMFDSVEEWYQYGMYLKFFCKKDFFFTKQDLKKQWRESRLVGIKNLKELQEFNEIYNNN